MKKTLFLAFGLAAARVIIQLILAAAGVGALPLTKQIYFSPIAVIFGSLVIGPAAGGLFHVYLSLIRGQSASAGDLMTGFKSFQDLFLAKLIPAVIAAACTFPFVIGNAKILEPLLEQLKQHQSTPPDFHEMLPVAISSYTTPLPLLLIGLLPMTYLVVNLQFTIPLIIDRQEGVWKGIVTSWKIVHKHWFHIFGLVVVVSLLNVAGACTCCAGLLVTIPLSTLAICYAYEDIFGRKAA